MPRPTQFRGRLTGKTALVTGAGSQGSGVGTGKAIAITFALEGARVCLVDRELERAQETLREIEAGGGEAFSATADVTNSADCAATVAVTLQRYGRLDILVNNVGIGVGGGRVEQLDEAVWSRVINVNLTSAILMSKHAIPALIATRGSIVNIASVAALRSHGGGVAYSASKAGLVAATRDLAVMYGREGVRANVVAPGHIFTPLVEGMLDSRAREVRRKVAPLGIEGDAWDIAAAALFLASDEARFITATCLPVDGGVVEVGALTAYGLIESTEGQ
jgi:NAD(P)-dependent dehydrogenase (short-subunit alcohol dehydrogenase family)